MDPAKLAKLQAQAASNRIGMSGHVSVICICASVFVGWSVDARCAFRWKGHSAAKDSAQVEAFKHPGRQEASGCAEETERAADHGRGGG